MTSTLVTQFETTTTRSSCARQRAQATQWLADQGSARHSHFGERPRQRSLEERLMQDVEAKRLLRNRPPCHEQSVRAFPDGGG